MCHLGEVEQWLRLLVMYAHCLYNRNQQELLKLTVTDFHFCSGAAKEGGSHGLMVPAALYFDLQERFDTVNFKLPSLTFYYIPFLNAKREGALKSYPQCME